MTNAVRIFAKQTYKASDFFAIAAGGADIDQAMAAALCSGMKKHWYLAARLKWANDWTGATHLEYKLWAYTAGVANGEKWRIPKGQQLLRSLVGLAIAEMAEPSRYKTDAAKVNWTGISASQFS